jgi:hypothetical protein
MTEEQAQSLLKRIQRMAKREGLEAVGNYTKDFGVLHIGIRQPVKRDSTDTEFVEDCLSSNMGVISVLKQKR